MVRTKIQQMSWSSLTEILTWNTEYMEGSHRVVLVPPQPDDRTVPMTRIVTDTVGQLLWERDSKRALAKPPPSFHDFTSQQEPSTMSFCGRGLFKPAFHGLCVVGHAICSRIQSDKREAISLIPPG
jgi:hypothetical protein